MCIVIRSFLQMVSMQFTHCLSLNCVMCQLLPIAILEEFLKHFSVQFLFCISYCILHIYTYMPQRFMSASAPYPSHKNNTLHSNLFWPSQDGWGGSFLHRCHNIYSSFTSTLSPYLTLFSV
jgi:hypothetical protein